MNPFEDPIYQNPRPKNMALEIQGGWLFSFLT
jgi:hypothetical protein